MAGGYIFKTSDLAQLAFREASRAVQELSALQHPPGRTPTPGWLTSWACSTIWRSALRSMARPVMPLPLFAARTRGLSASCSGDLASDPASTVELFGERVLPN